MGILTSISFITNYFLNNFEVLFITYGVGVGFGTGIITVANTAILPHYFHKRLGLATGVSKTGTAVGMFIFAGLNQVLIDQYGLQGAFLILSAISLNAIPLGLLMREPVSISKRDTERELLIVKDTRSGISVDKPAECFNDIYKNSTPKSTDRWSGFELLKNGHYVLLQLANFLIIISHFVIPTMLPEHIVLLGGSKQQGANTVVIMGAANIFSRLVLGNIKTENPKLLMVILAASSMVSGASLLFSILFTAYWMYVCLSIIFGLTRGIYVITYILLTVKITGHEKSHHAYGITFSVFGLGILIGLPSSGVLADITSSQFQYSIVFMSVGTADVLTAVLFVIMYVTWKEVAESRTN